MKLAIAALLLTGCATTSAPDWALLGPHPHKIGPVRVFVLNAADVATTCRGFSHAIQRTPPASPLGCYVMLNSVPTIITTENVYVLLHEWKHYFDPEWRHK